jgi:hypothetical protein
MAHVQTRKSFIVATFLLVFAPVVSAQEPGQTPAERAALVRDAFASPYGRALTAEFGRSLRKDADPDCLRAKSLQPDQLEGRGRDTLIRWGMKFEDGIASFFDAKAYAEKFPASAELGRLKQNADVKRYLATAAPARQAKLLDAIFEQFDRHVLISRIKLTAVSPLATGNEELLGKNPTDATEEALHKFVASRKSAALKRFLDLSDQAVAASTTTIRKDQILALGGAHQLFRGVETDLAELCIGRRS